MTWYHTLRAVVGATHEANDSGRLCAIRLHDEDFEVGKGKMSRGWFVQSVCQCWYVNFDASHAA